MKLQKIISTFAFKGIREDRNTTEQLKKENDYSLTDNNQKKISKAIENLGKNNSEKNIEFLLDVADNLKYGTNIKNTANPRNDWKLKLQKATETSLAMSNPITREKFAPEVSRVFYAQKPLSEDEKQILESKENILKNINKNELENEKNSNIKDVEKNLNHLIISSEIPLHQKKYILNRLEYLLSPEYNINPQLANKKTVVLAEILNDLVVTNGGKIPNTKAINQKQHGMCAAISIARKLMSYEYKTDFVDSILSELDDTEELMVYDLANLDEKKKIPVQKTYVDFQDAMRKGYRIIDASTTQWMHVADMFGVDNKSELVYTPFDSAHFGTFTDTHYNSPLEDITLQAKQSYYQSLIKAKENIDAVKLHKVNDKVSKNNVKENYDSNLETIASLNNQIAKLIKDSNTNISTENTRNIVRELLNLEKDFSMNINKIKDDTKNYSFIHNEEDSIKDKKIKSFLKDKFGIVLTDKTATDIKDLVLMSNSISRTIKPSNSIASKISFDRKLFNAAAAYRTSTMIALTDSDLRTDAMIHYDILDNETYVSKSLQKYAEKVNSGDTRYLKSIAQTFGIPANKKAVLEVLQNLKLGYDYNTTKALDDMYGILGATDRKTALLNKVLYIKDTIQKGDKDNLRIMSVAMKMPKDKNKIIQKLEQFEQTLKNNPQEGELRYIINKLGIKNQYDEFAEAYKTMADAIKEPENEFNKKIIENMKIANGLSKDAHNAELEPMMVQLAQLYNGLLENLTQLRNSLVIVDEKGIFIDSTNPQFEIVKKMENEGKIIPTSELLRLQIRYDAIDKIRSQDEFSSRQGKISDPSLYKYTKGEKETLRKIEKSIGRMTSDTNRELLGMYKELKEPLEDSARKIGSNMGMYWSMPEGSSGLYSFQQAKILQQLTGKPYQILENFDKAIEMIKTTPHSGISGTNVFHTKPGGHAQYISEIAEHNGKDILFHDNSWGASEHENTWIDSEGLMRTDYSDNRGGELGYITDQRFRNGNYVENLLEKTGDFKGENINSKALKKLKGENEPYKFALIYDIILPGISEEANNIAASIKDNLFLPDSRFLGSFETQLSHMTLDEIRSAKKRSQNAGLTYKKELEEIEKRLETTPFKKGIETKADYDALPDNDPLKVAFEKVAFDMSYNYISKWKEMAKINDIQGINQLKADERKTARDNFDYAFSKSNEILYAYALNRIKNNIYDILTDTLEKYDIKISQEDKINIFRNIAVFEKDEKDLFDGSLKHTIEFMANKLATRFDMYVPKTEATQKAKDEIVQKIISDISKGLYYNKKDLLKQTELNKAIVKYIDKKYQPQTDDEFVAIYRHLQDMTTEEFKKETADATDEDMAFKNISGYDVLKRFKASNGIIQEKIANVVYQKHLLKDIDISETTPHFQYKKLQKKVRGAYYDHGKSYDDMYRGFKYSLMGLTYEKLFNKYKNTYYKKYGIMPAYPKIEVIDDNAIRDEIDLIENKVSEYAALIRSKKLNLQAYETTDKITELLNRYPDDKKLTKTQAQILNTLVGEFITDNYTDLGFKKALASAEKMLELSHKTATVKDYKEAFKDWYEQVEAVKNLHAPENLKNSIKIDVARLKSEVNIVVRTGIPKKFENKIMESVDKFTNEIYKEAITGYDIHDANRVLKQKLTNHVLPKTTAEKIEDFQNNLDLQIAQAKKLKHSFINKKTQLEKQNQDVITTMLAFMEDSVSDEKIEEFPNLIMEIYRRTDNLDAQTLKAEISEYTGIPETELEQNEFYNKINSNILKYNKTFKIKEKYQASIKEKSNKIEDTINHFIEKQIKPDYSRATAKILENYTKREILAKNTPSQFSVDRWAVFKDNLIENYKRYHYWNYPIELLDRYTELCAKDGEIAKAAEAKDKKLTEFLELERNFARNSLKAAIDYAELIEMQEILMDSAKELGNPALVTKKFKNYDTEYWDDKTGSRLTLADSKIINLMVRKLLYKKNNNTAIMFVEKLGLVEQFIERENEMFDIDKTKKKVDSLIKILKTVNKQNEILDEELEKFTDDDLPVEEFINLIDETKQNIINKTKKLNRQKTVKKILGKFDDVKVIVGANPGLPKTVVLEQTMRELKEEISSDTNNDISEIQNELNEINMIYKLISEINIPKYRKADQYKQEFNKKFEEIENYRNETLTKVVADSSAIDIKTNPA